MLRSEKQEFVIELEEICKQSSSIIITHYHGLTASQMTSLRRALRDKGANLKIVKNTLLKRAVDKIGLKDVGYLFSGPTAIAYSNDPVGVTKTIVDFAKINEKLRVISGIINNQILNADSIQQLSKLPSLNELRAKIISMLQTPASKIIGILQAPASKCVRVLHAYTENTDKN